MYAVTSSIICSCFQLPVCLLQLQMQVAHTIGVDADVAVARSNSTIEFRLLDVIGFQANPAYTHRQFVVGAKSNAMISAIWCSTSVFQMFCKSKIKEEWINLFINFKKRIFVFVYIFFCVSLQGIKQTSAEFKKNQYFLHFKKCLA